jgi:hypothetical protein
MLLCDLRRRERALIDARQGRAVPGIELKIVGSYGAETAVARPVGRRPDGARRRISPCELENPRDGAHP